MVQVYHAAGNVTNDGVNSYLYDAEGRVCAVQSTPIPGNSTYTGYLYDADGNRVAKGSLTTMSCDLSLNTNGVPHNGFQFTQSYVLGPSGEELTQFSVTAGVASWQRTNVYAAGKLIATYDLAGSQPALHFHLTDPLGTRRMQLSGNLTNLGQPETDCQSLPFGDQLNCFSDPNASASASGGDDGNPLHFTGKERDTESGNDYFGARYYSSAMGRFMSPDPGPWQLENPQYLNMYNYALNNPLRYTDAEGETPEDRVLKAIQLTTQNIPYKSGGHSEATGLDCSGLVADVWKSDPDSVMNLSVNGPGGGAANEASEFQNNGAGQWSTDINNAQPGDAIFFANDSGTIVHTGIVVDIRDGKVYFVHAPKPGEKVKPYYIKINNPKLGGEKFAGLGRSIENGHSSTSNSNKPNAWQRFTNWVSSLFSDQPPAEPQANVSATSCATGPDGKVTCQ